MIKVVASDLDGTLLTTDHCMDPETYKTIKQAQEAGICFVIVTGRDYAGTCQVLEGYPITCDMILGSGAEVRDSQGKILTSIPMDAENFSIILQRLQDLDVSIRFCGGGINYFVGTREEAAANYLREAQLFFTNASEEEILQSAQYKRLFENTVCLNSIEELLTKSIPIFKVFISGIDVKVIAQADERLRGLPHIVSASSFAYNIELTHDQAQKGPILKKYIEEKGYTMDEVMVLGDSMNDYSMLSMKYGMTVAMENAMEPVKQVVKYITTDNDHYGVKRAIEKFCDFE